MPIRASAGSMAPRKGRWCGWCVVSEPMLGYAAWRTGAAFRADGIGSLVLTITPVKLLRVMHFTLIQLSVLPDRWGASARSEMTSAKLQKAELYVDALTCL